MATTRLSDLTTEIEKALTDEAYDGSSGPLNEAQFSKYVRRLAEAAVEVIGDERPSIVGATQGIATGRSGDALADAVERGDQLTEVEQQRVVLAMKNAQISRLVGRIGRAIVAVQADEPEHIVLGMLRGEARYSGDAVARAEADDE